MEAGALQDVKEEGARDFEAQDPEFVQFTS
jgi:hypothetical protein